MGGKCKLCLKYIQGDSVVILDKNLLAKLVFIQLNLNRSEEESNSICYECKEKIQNAFDFKFCLVQTESSDSSPSGSQARNICNTGTSNGEYSTKKTICRLCKNSVAVISVISLEKLLKNDKVMKVFQGHIPEVELKELSSMVCEPCQKSVDSFSMLVSSWSIANDGNGVFEVKKEERDELFDTNTNSSCTVDASDSGKIVKKSKGNAGQITKVKTEGDELSDCSECVSMNNIDGKIAENEEDEVDQDLKLKDEEVNIKDEDGASRITNVETESLAPNGKKSNWIGNVKQQTNTHESFDKIVLFKHDNCSPYETKFREYLKTYEEVGIFKCTHCSYRTDLKDRLKFHMKTHETIVKQVFKCENCPFETKWKCSLNSHKSRHMSLNEDQLLTEKISLKQDMKTRVNVETQLNKLNRKKYLIKVMKSQRRGNKVKFFKCKYCPYETKCITDLKPHLKIHNTIKIRSVNSAPMKLSIDRKSEITYESLSHLA